MATFWDLLPASPWPTQPFIPPFDPTQAAWPPAALPPWNPATPAAFGWPMFPAASAGAPLDAASVSPWANASPQAPVAQAGAIGDAGAVDDDPRVAEAKRAYAFAKWFFGPPSAPQPPTMGAAALTGAPLNASPPPPSDADQSAGLGAASGNPNVERQGARAPVAASQQPPPSFRDLSPASAWPTQPFIPSLDPTQPSAWPAQIAPPQWSIANPSTFAAASANAPFLEPSTSPWDSAMHQAIAAQTGAPRNADVRDRAYDGAGARNAVPTGETQTILADKSATPVAASRMSTPGPDGASNSAPSPNEPAGATYNPFTWTAADNPLSWIQQQYERQYPERADAIKRMADTRLGDVPSIDAPNAARRMADGFAYGYGNEPIIPYQNIGPDTTMAAGGHALPDWAQPDARFLWRSANVAPQLLDRALRALGGGAYGAAGAAAGLYQDLGGSEAWADRLQRDLGILPQYAPADMSLVRPMALEPHRPARALEPGPRDVASLADSDAPASAPRSSAGPEAALDVGAPQYTREQADLIRNWLGIAPERFRGGASEGRGYPHLDAKSIPPPPVNAPTPPSELLRPPALPVPPLPALGLPTPPLHPVVSAPPTYPRLPGPRPGTQQPWKGPIVNRPVAAGGETFYRTWGGGSPEVGRWLSPYPPASAQEGIRDLALSSSNTAAFVSPVRVPAGVRINWGTANEAFGHPGGGLQIELMEKIPPGSYGPAAPLPRK